MVNLTPDEYVNQLFQEDELLLKVKEAIRADGMPEVSVAAAYGRLLTFLAKTSKAEAVLEIGVLGGYSGICLARGLSEGGTLTSLELKEEYAKEWLADIWRKVALAPKCSTGSDLQRDSLERLAQEGRTFDFFFIDADKENYPVYLDYAIRLARPGAVIVGDNCFLRGRTLNPDKQGPAVLAVRRFNEQMASDPRLITTIFAGL